MNHHDERDALLEHLLEEHEIGPPRTPARAPSTAQGSRSGPAPPGSLLTAAQLASRWQVPTSQVYRLARADQLPSVALGRYRRFRLDAIEAFELAALRKGA